MASSDYLICDGCGCKIIYGDHIDGVICPKCVLGLMDELASVRSKVAELEAALTEIANYAQERSQGPTVFDALWDVRSKALMALRGEWT